MATECRIVTHSVSGGLWLERKLRKDRCIRCGFLVMEGHRSGVVLVLGGRLSAFFTLSIEIGCISLVIDGLNPDVQLAYVVDFYVTVFHLRHVREKRGGTQKVLKVSGY